jgi:hypothetical protein
LRVWHRSMNAAGRKNAGSIVRSGESYAESRCNYRKN